MQLELVLEVSPGPERWQRRVEDRTRKLLAAARSRWPGRPIPNVRVSFDLRGHAAGEACLASRLTKYNGELLTRYGESFIHEIVPHEVAHIVAESVFGGAIRPHGGEWKAVMRFFGAEPRIHHDFETTPARRLRLFAYGCACGDIHHLSARSHRRILRGTVEFKCNRCRQTLTFAGG